jgi:hypothetical protein
MSPNESKAQLQIDAAVKHMRALQEQKRYDEALRICLEIAHAYPGMSNPWIDAAANCIALAHWQDAVRYAQIALSCGGNNFSQLYGTLAHAHAALGQWDKTRQYGLQALTLRARRFSSVPAIPLPNASPLPPLPSAQTRQRNVIAFSLFGGDSKYCETAVLNVQEQPHIYPDWVCRFYVDDSVPVGVLDRLRKGGAQIVPVQGIAAQWPGPMWRFLALDDPQAHRILFRDADSLISQREAAAVAQWLTSGKRFHMMRDGCSHTELILAGLWGVVAGSLPPLEKLMQLFIRTPLKSKHFADQDFLRRYVWPYARTSLMQHDSVFGFMNAIPFPEGERSYDFHVGAMESAVYSIKVKQPDRSTVSWALYWIERRDSGRALVKLVCSYTNTVQDGMVKAYIPRRYAQWIRQGTARIGLIAHAVPHGAPPPQPPIPAALT